MTKMIMGDVYNVKHTLVEGDALAPTDYDVISLSGTLDAGKPRPSGWRVLDGNMHSSTVVAIAQRYMVTGDFIE